MSTGVHQPSARSCFFTAGLLYFESNSCSFCDAYCHDIQGAGLSKPLVLFWHRHREGAWNKLATSTLSWLSFIPDMLSYLALLSLLLGNRWKEVPGFWLGLLSNSLCMSRRTASFSIVPQPILTLRIPSLTSRSAAYHRGHLNWVISIVVATRAFQSAHLLVLPFTTILLRAAKEQPDVTSYIPCILLLACNWSITPHTH